MDRVTRRITGRGMLLICLAIGQFFLATHFSNNLVFLSCFFALGLVISAIVTTWPCLRGVKVRLLPPEAAAVGGIARLRFLVERGARTDGLTVVSGPFTAVASPAAPGCLEAKINATERQIIQLSKFELAGTDPFGLFRVSRTLRPDEAGPVEIVLYPQPDWACPTQAAPAQSEQGAGRIRGAYAGLRPYRPGDARSDVSWRASARTQGLIVKEYESAGTDRAQIFELEATGDALEANLSSLTAAVLGAAREGTATGLRLPGLEIGPDRGERHLSQLLAALAGFGKTRR
ncbi:MAG: DUF58 domain-containing protein [Pseudomonadota bacterium]